MDTNNADYLLKQWSIWSRDVYDELEYRTASWQRRLSGGYAETAPEEAIAAGDDDLMVLVDAAVTGLCQKIPYYGMTVKRHYLRGKPIDDTELNFCINALVEVYCEKNDR